MGCKVGEPVTLEFTSANATTAAAITIKDANLVTRTLLSSERLLIDTLKGTTDTSTSFADRLEIFNDTDADGNVDANERIAALHVYYGDGRFDGGKEGASCRVGTTPKAKANFTGQVWVTGTGRIVNALGRTTKPTWK